MSYSALQRVVANPRALAAYIDDGDNDMGEEEQRGQQQQQQQLQQKPPRRQPQQSNLAGMTVAADRPPLSSAVAVGEGGGVGGVAVSTAIGDAAGVGGARGSAKLSGAGLSLLRSSQCSQAVHSGGRKRPILGAEHEATEVSRSGRSREAGRAEEERGVIFVRL